MEWFSSAQALFHRGLTAAPKSLVLRFNAIRVFLHFGGPAERAEALRLLEETLQIKPDEWSMDVNEDVFPWDFFPQLFNYRTYFDLVTRQLMHGAECEAALKNLIYASLNYYRGFFTPNQGFYNGGLDCFGQAVALDPEFPYYQFHYARELLLRGLPEDDLEASKVLVRLSEQSILFLEAFEVLEDWNNGRRPRASSGTLKRLRQDLGRPQPPTPELQSRIGRFLDRHRSKMQRAKQQIDFAEPIGTNLVAESFPVAEAPGQVVSRGIVTEELAKLRYQVRWMESSKFWKLRGAWMGLRRFMGLKVQDMPEDY